MLVTTLPRHVIMSLMPKNGVAAEVGVYRCNFAKQIVAANAPAKLHLIDPWEEDGEYVKTYGAKDDMPGLHENARMIFSEQIEKGSVILHRDFSHNVAPEFADGSLDWAYIDGMHTYEAVKADLEAFAPKIAPNGLLLGHDFSNSPESRRRNFGVVRAVREFVAENPFEFVAFTYEVASTFILARTDHPKAGADLRKQILDHPGGVHFEIDEGVLAGFDHFQYVNGEGKKRPLFRFRADIPDEQAAIPKTSEEPPAPDKGWFSRLRRKAG